MDDFYVEATIINNEFDYSNIVANIESLAYLVQYCDQMNKELNKLVEEDFEKNKQFKEEYRDYMYKKSYNQYFEINIKNKIYNTIICKNYETFIKAAQNGNLNQVSKLTITLNLNFDRGKKNNYEKHENSFKIIFKPYDITFTRTSNYNDLVMNKIEEHINSILNQFPVVNSIFCTKEK